MISVPVFCTICHSGQRDDHVHKPLPCANGKPERHHEFAQPAWVRVEVEGHVKRLRVPA